MAETPETPATPETPQNPFSLAGRPDEEETRLAQVQSLIEAAREKGQPLRIRIPVTIFDQRNTARGYASVKEASWNIALDSTVATPDHIAAFIDALDEFVCLVVDHGVDAAKRRLLMEEA